jgi:hypothetical protein
MRLPLLKPSELDEEQKTVYDSIREVTDVAFKNFKFMKDDGELIGPFNAMLRFPKFGAAALQKIATLAAGQRPADLTPEESVAFDIAYALNQSGPIAESTYCAGEAVFGREGMAEIIYLVGTFHLIAIILNGYDVSVPGREEGLD